MLKQYPLGLFFLPFWLYKGKVYLKEKLAHHVSFNWETLPYREPVLNLIESARKSDRPIVLVTASPLAWATGVANYLACFDDVLATEKSINLSGKNKVAHLVKLFGERCFDYAGDSAVDLYVWAHADSAIVVSQNQNLLKQATLIAYDVQVIKWVTLNF